jgi:hypothetical protein
VWIRIQCRALRKLFRSPRNTISNNLGEIYRNVLPEHYRYLSLHTSTVPILVTSGSKKKISGSGWRIGWIGDLRQRRQAKRGTISYLTTPHLIHNFSMGSGKGILTHLLIVGANSLSLKLSFYLENFLRPFTTKLWSAGRKMQLCVWSLEGVPGLVLSTSSAIKGISWLEILLITSTNIVRDRIYRKVDYKSRFFALPWSCFRRPLDLFYENVYLHLRIN